ncbi:hypothetical protein M9H77_26987 [Catharanthus roseus]|uniref:Uncharacterized protein n=1 Tax=Catharanthus roseus TaxID=4058 RepID=A0ACC0ABM1_CATRO|nr:hypothetical protein M9H77_26987 [Catharanthus roseus]
MKKKKNPFRPGCRFWLRSFVRKRHKIALYVASPPYEGLFRWRGRFRLGRVDPLEEGHRPRRISSGWSGAQLEPFVKFLFLLSCKVVDCREARRCPTQPQFT